MSSVVTVTPAVLSSVLPDCSVPTAVMAGFWSGVLCVCGAVVLCVCWRVTAIKVSTGSFRLMSAISPGMSHWRRATTGSVSATAACTVISLPPV